MNIQANLVDPQRWNRYAYARNNPLRYVDPDGRNADVACTGGSCVVSVSAQIVADPNDAVQVAAANAFKTGAETYWNAQSVTAPSGEALTFNVGFTVVGPNQARPGVDTLTVVTGSGRSRVDMTLDLQHPNTTSPPDTGVIFTQDNTGNPSGMAGIAAHETGHLMGLRDTYPPSGHVPYSPGPQTDIMKGAQPTNSPSSAFRVLSPTNGDSVVTRRPDGKP